MILVKCNIRRNVDRIGQTKSNWIQKKRSGIARWNGEKNSKRQFYIFAILIIRHSSNVHIRKCLDAEHWSFVHSYVVHFSFSFSFVRSIFFFYFDFAIGHVCVLWRWFIVVFFFHRPFRCIKTVKKISFAIKIIIGTRARFLWLKIRNTMDVVLIWKMVKNSLHNFILMCVVELIYYNIIVSLQAQILINGFSNQKKMVYETP